MKWALACIVQHVGGLALLQHNRSLVSRKKTEEVQDLSPHTTNPKELKRCQVVVQRMHEDAIAAVVPDLPRLGRYCGRECSTARLPHQQLLCKVDRGHERSASEQDLPAWA